MPSISAQKRNGIVVGYSVYLGKQGDQRRQRRFFVQRSDAEKFVDERNKTPLPIGELWDRKGKVVGEFVEVESGKNNDRPQLMLALTECRRLKATLVVAKLDRLSRNAEFLLRLQNGNVDFVCCDCPNHSPQWYHDRGLDEDSPPSLRALINADVKLLDEDDSTLTPGEKLGNYEEAWNLILKNGDGNASAADLQKVLEREGELGYVPSELYAKPPFSLIAKLIDKHGLSTTEVGVFLKWTAKNDNLKKARAAMKKPAKKSKQKTFINKFLEARRGKPIPRDSDL